MDIQRRHIQIDEKAIYRNDSRFNLNEILFNFEPNLYPGALEALSLRWGEQTPVRTYVLDQDRLVIPLPKPLLPGGKVQVNFSYSIQIPARPGPFGYTSRQLNLWNFYFRIPPYEERTGWLVHPKGIVGENEVYDMADFTVDLHLDHSPAGSVIAASAPGVETSEGIHYTVASARNFTISFSSEMALSTGQVGGVTVNSYYFTQDEEAGKATLKTTLEALAIYQEKFAPYPHPQLTLVEADFPDGMEADGFYFLGKDYYLSYDGTPQSYLAALSAHETAHQWWFALVGDDQAVEPWLDEALATYSELIYYQASHPQAVDWWWNFRIQRFHPVGWVNSSIYDFDRFRPYVNAVYLRGALMLDRIRKDIGDEQFGLFLREYARTYSGKIAHTTDFLQLLDHYIAGSSLDEVASFFKSPP